MRSVIAAWRSPERLAASPAWREPDAALIDVSIFGEAGLIPARRGASGRPIADSARPRVAPRGSEGAVVVAEMLRTDAGTVALRGPMVPHHAFPPGIERSGLPYFKIGPGGLVDTGYTCRVDAAGKGMVVTGPPPGIVSVGGYRFPLRDLQDAVGRIDQHATLAALPDPLRRAAPDRQRRRPRHDAGRARRRRRQSARRRAPFATAATTHRGAARAPATAGLNWCQIVEAALR